MPQPLVSCVNAENIADDASSQNMPIAVYTCCQSHTLRRNTIDMEKSISAALAGKTASLRLRTVPITSALVLVPTGAAPSAC